jgi:hypothetical protein
VQWKARLEAHAALSAAISKEDRDMNPEVITHDGTTVWEASVYELVVNGEQYFYLFTEAEAEGLEHLIEGLRDDICLTKIDMIPGAYATLSAVFVEAKTKASGFEALKYLNAELKTIEENSAEVEDECQNNTT